MTRTLAGCVGVALITAIACGTEDSPPDGADPDAAMATDAAADARATDVVDAGQADAPDTTPSDAALDVPSDVLQDATLDCANHPAPAWALVDARTFEGAFGTPWPFGTNNEVQLISHVQNPNTSIQVLAIEFVAPPAGDPLGAGRLSQNPDNGQMFMFMSRCPGDVNWSQGRIGCSVSGFTLAWRIPGGSPQVDRCLLEPGEKYYMNVAFVLGSSARSGAVEDLCGFGTAPPYSLTCSARLLHGLY